VPVHARKKRNRRRCKRLRRRRVRGEMRQALRFSSEERDVLARALVGRMGWSERPSRGLDDSHFPFAQTRRFGALDGIAACYPVQELRAGEAGRSEAARVSDRRVPK